MDTPIRESIAHLLGALEAQAAEAAPADGASERVRLALEAAREAEEAWSSHDGGFVQLPESGAETPEDGGDAAQGNAMEHGDAGADALRRELQTVRAAYEDAKHRMVRFEQSHEELQHTIEVLKQERDTLRARIVELDAARAGAAPRGASDSRAVPNEGFEAFTATGQKRRLGEILVEAGVISDTQLQELLEEQARRPQSRLGVLVVERGITSEEIVARVLAAQLRLPYLELDQYKVVEAAALQVPEEIARRHECIAIDGDLHSMTLAMANPLDLLAIENIEITCKRRVAAVVAKPSAVMAAIGRAYASD